MRLLLDAASPINDRDTNGCTPLFTAVRAEAPTTVLRLLIEQGAEVDSAPEGEPTALALAAGMGSVEAVRVLVSRLVLCGMYAERRNNGFLLTLDILAMIPVFSIRFGSARATKQYQVAEASSNAAVKMIMCVCSVCGLATVDCAEICYY